MHSWESMSLAFSTHLFPFSSSTNPGHDDKKEVHWQIKSTGKTYQRDGTPQDNAVFSHEVDALVGFLLLAAGEEWSQFACDPTAVSSLL